MVRRYLTKSLNSTLSKVSKMKMGQDFRNKFVLNKNLGFKTPGVIQNEREIPQDAFS